LWATVVRRAASDWVIYRKHKNEKCRKLAEEARSWIFDEDDPLLENSFVTICRQLDLSVGVVRRKISELTEEEVKKRRGMEFGDE